MIMLTIINTALALPAFLLQSVCWVETNHRNIDNMNDGGSPSYGICQIKLGTAKWLHEKHKLHGTVSEENLRTEEVNAFYAGLYLKWQLSRYNGNINKAVSAYNAGTFTNKNKKYVYKVTSRMAYYKQQGDKK